MKAGKTLNRFSAALREPYELVSRLFDDASLGFGILDKQFRYRAVNRALAAMNDPGTARAHLGSRAHLTCIGGDCSNVGGSIPQYLFLKWP